MVPVVACAISVPEGTAAAIHASKTQVREITMVSPTECLMSIQPAIDGIAAVIWRTCYKPIRGSAAVADQVDAITSCRPPLFQKRWLELTGIVTCVRLICGS